MSLSIDDLFSAQTSDQIRAAMVTNLVALGVPADKWNKGGVFSTILTICAMALSLTSGLITALIRGFFLPTATGLGLKLIAKYIYGVTVPDATFASGTVTLTNSGGASYTFQPGQFTCQNATTKVNYTNDAVFTLSSGGTATPHVIANVAGAAGNAAPGAITTLVTSLSQVTVTNPTSLVGVDAPSDSTIRTLCLNKLGALSVRGVRTAYAYAIQVATNSVTGAPVNVNRWSVSSASHTGIVTVIVASPSGAADPDDVTGIATSIEAIARPEAVSVNLASASSFPYTVSIIVYCKLPDGVNSADVKAAIDLALVSFISTYPIGGESATDDANPSTPLRGIFASGVYGVIAEAIADLDGIMIAAQGAVDVTMLSGQVVTDGISTTVRVIAPTSGTTVV
jgi:hypothetical protein